MTPPTLDHERLTAYALNELDATERAAIEAQLKNDPEAQRHVADVRATAALLETELKQERLGDLARTFAATKTAPIAPPPPIEKPRANRFVFYAAAIAAMLMLGVVLWNSNAFRPQYDAHKESVAYKSADAPKVVAQPNATANPAVVAPIGLTPIQPDASKSASSQPHAKDEDDLRATRVDVPKDTLDKSQIGDHFESNTGAKNIPPLTTTTPSKPPKPEEIFSPDNLKPIRMGGAKILPVTPANPQVVSPSDVDPGKVRDAINAPLLPVAEKPVKPSATTTGPIAMWTKPDPKADDNKPHEFFAIPKNEGEKTRFPAATEIKEVPGLATLPIVGNVFDKKDKEAPAEPAKKPADIHIATGRPDETKKGKDVLIINGSNAKIQPADPSVGPSAPVSPPTTKPATPQTKSELEEMMAEVARLNTGKSTNSGGGGGGGSGGFVPKTPTAPGDKEAYHDVYRSAMEAIDDFPVATKKDKIENFYVPSPTNSIPPSEVKTPPQADWDKFDKSSPKRTEPPTIQRPTIDQADKLAYKFEAEKKTRNPKGLEPIYGSVEIPPASIVVPQPGGETYGIYPEHAFQSVRTAPLSTFSADVDTASYSNVRRFLTTNNQLPPPDAVRTEELVNYFKYNVDTLKTEGPFGVNVEAAACPWNGSNRLVRVAIKAADIANNQRPASNLVFLIDVSGSMNDPKRLPLVQEGMKALVRRLNANDRVAIVTYANGSGVPLPSTTCADKDRIISVIDSLRAEGNTNGGAGIQTAYETARQNFIKGGVNRVILATDGDFNVGTTDTRELVRMIEAQTPSGVFLTALGYGMGNIKDEMLQKLADKGNGHYAYIDTADESRKVLIEQMNATLVTVAKDVKFQVEFNPSNAAAYRLIGYEKRTLAAQDFNNDAKDAGEVGAGHTVTAFYEVVPTNASQPGVDPLKYQPSAVPPERKVEPANGSPELLTLKIRFKQPDSNESKKLEFAFTDKGTAFEQATSDFKFASAVALFGQILKHSAQIQAPYMRRVIEIADDNRGTDEGGYRREFIQLARKAAELRGER